MVQAEGLTFAELLYKTAKITAVDEESNGDQSIPNCILRVEGDDHLWFRGPKRLVERFAAEWQSFQSLGHGDRGVAFDALTELDEQLRPSIVRRLSTLHSMRGASGISGSAVSIREQENQVSDTPAVGESVLPIMQTD